MPGGDQTGPMGQGPMTGRAAGYCAGNNQAGWMSRTVGRFFGQGQANGGGRGRGRGQGGGGRGRRFQGGGMPGWQQTPMGQPTWAGTEPLPTSVPDRPNMTRDQELVWLKQQAQQLDAGLEQIRSRIEELSKAAAK